MNSPTLTRLELDEHLAKGIPALSKAAGIISCHEKFKANINLTHPSYQKNKEWHKDDKDLANRWLHSDVINMGFFFNYNHKVTVTL